MANSRARDRLPSPIRVGAISYTVELWDASEADEADRMGEWDGSRGRIRIRDGMPADVTATILLHELGHAVSSNKGLVDGMTEEAFVIGSWENGLSQLIRDNPGLMPWVAKQFR